MTVILGGGGGGNTPFPTMVFQTSRTWACPMAMEAMVFVIGAGGGGAGGFANSGSQVITNGGGGGGCSISKLTFAAQDYTVVVGSRGGGGSRTQTQNTGVGDGIAGGSSSLAGSGITTMVGNGGGAGSGAAGSGSQNSGTVAGGTATGGNIANNTGGGGPNRGVYYNLANACSGGGVGIWEAGENNLRATGNNTIVQGGGPFRSRDVGITSIPTGEGGITGNSVLTGDIFKGIQQMVRDISANGYASHPNRWHNSINYTGRPVQLAAPANATQYRYPAGSSPFTGGAGMQIAGASYTGRGSDGVAGGGGGSCSFYNAGVAAYGGVGGNGVIIIMPLTVGT